jgi:hypothetical protein
MVSWSTGSFERSCWVGSTPQALDAPWRQSRAQGLEHALDRLVEGQLIGMRGEMTGLRETMDARFQTVDARMQTIDTKIDLLDRDIQALSKRVFGAE